MRATWRWHATGVTCAKGRTNGNRPPNTRSCSAVSPAEQRLGRALHHGRRANHGDHRRWARDGATSGDE
jgi:hypothetical protein